MQNERENIQIQLPKGGYAPDENTPFGLFRKEAQTIAEENRKKEGKQAKTASRKIDDNVYVEEPAPGVKIPIPGLDKKGNLKRKAKVTWEETEEEKKKREEEELKKKAQFDLNVLGPPGPGSFARWVEIKSAEYRAQAEVYVEPSDQYGHPDAKHVSKLYIWKLPEDERVYSYDRGSIDENELEQSKVSEIARFIEENRERIIHSGKQAGRMITIKLDGRTAEAPEIWIGGMAEKFVAEGQASDIKEGYAKAIKYWFEQEDMGRQFDLEHGIEGA